MIICTLDPLSLVNSFKTVRRIIPMRNLLLCCTEMRRTICMHLGVFVLPVKKLSSKKTNCNGNFISHSNSIHHSTGRSLANSDTWYHAAGEFSLRALDNPGFKFFLDRLVSLKLHSRHDIMPNAADETSICKT
ncbi:hypothetical protein MPH_12509 [Macrophomina phaseolina MS6]|uniref:Uncharacterized protein n=1 Tax=Macrophomina phaseolina (strain MS6) TaxID=1126212 RepID=K2S110_MACPH|nr:hypothetical protein MPH_12509 [Macrophomina phaseolina MS6]